MGPIGNGNAGEFARFTELLQDALMQQDFSQQILSNLPDYTRSGTQPPNPRMSRALANVPIPEITTRPDLPASYFYEQVPVQDLVRQHMARQSEIEILRAAQALNAPNSVPGRTPPQAPPRTPRPPATGAARSANPLLMLLQLALFPQDLNEKEDDQLRAKRGPDYKNTMPQGSVAPEIRNALGLMP
jgi:hypothetical protein